MEARASCESPEQEQVLYGEAPLEGRETGTKIGPWDFFSARNCSEALSLGPRIRSWSSGSTAVWKQRARLWKQK